MAILRSDRERQMALIGIGRGQSAEKLVCRSKSGVNWQIRLRSRPDQLMSRLEFAVENCPMKRAIGVCSIRAQGDDQRYLHYAFARDTARYNQTQRLVTGLQLRRCFEDHSGDVNNICRQDAVPNRVFRNEFKQAGIAEVIPAFKQDAAMNKIWILYQQETQA